VALPVKDKPRDEDGRQSLRGKLRPLFRRTPSGQRFISPTQPSSPSSPVGSARSKLSSSSSPGPASPLLTPDASRTPVGDKTPISTHTSPSHPSAISSYFPYMSASSVTDVLLTPVSDSLGQLVPRSLAHLSANEHLSTTCLSLPAASVGALWRCLRGLDWLGQRYPFFEQRPGPSQDVFDMTGVLQACGDMLAATAAEAGVELVIEEDALREVIVQGDETGWLIALVTVSSALAMIPRGTGSDLLYIGQVLRTIMAEARPGSSIEATLDAVPSSSTGQGEETHWKCAVDIALSPALLSDDPPRCAPPDSFLASALLRYLHINFVPQRQETTKRTWKLSGDLKSAAMPAAESSTTVRDRSLDMAKEPSVQELAQFAEALKGRKAVLHAAENSVFAEHLTGALTTWGIDISHMPLERDDQETTGSTRPLSQDMSSTGAPGYPTADSSKPGYPNLAPGHDPQANFIVIDDDVATLQRQLTLLRNAPAPINLHLPNTLMSKRPQLHSRRTRSSQHLYRTTGERPVQTVIVHFASLSNYRKIRDLVQSVLRTLGVTPPPEVVVIPKPAGTRRLLMALYVAIKRPVLDPFFSPIATSPSSPGGPHYFASARPSPASSLQNEFELAAGAHLDGRPPSIAGSTAGDTASANKSQSGPPSPMPAEALEYIQRTAAELGGSPSSGYVIQTWDGKPSGLFFQPQGSPSYRPVAKPEAEAGGRPNGNAQAAEPVSPLSDPDHVALTPLLPPSVVSAPGATVATPAQERPQAVPLEALPLTARPIEVLHKGGGTRSTGDLHTIRHAPELPRILSAPATTLPKATPAPVNKASSPPAKAPSPPPGRQDSLHSPTSPPSAASQRRGTISGKPVTSHIKTSPPTSPPGEASQSPKSNRDQATSPSSAKARSPRSRSFVGQRRPTKKLTGPLVPPINVLVVEGKLNPPHFCQPITGVAN
jgi:osomolarity two-component system response regulator SSK1